ncbi:LacI family DNA-binding transcriptional regulator [Sciscionella sediminilitoris]|uniref:LacI family DNA-binding transcriptional regulator n=1 Tax=Sciscionella sediminilitoris TaxID=1445613 RepID=UPI000691961D|nr:LacI family DNA-binding transcriptional regulator [Sciscionella sp. SE31]
MAEGRGSRAGASGGRGSTPGLADVARRAGVSVGLVSRILNGDGTLRTRAETREQVLAAARELNYVPHGAARALRLARAGAIGLVVHDVSNPIHAEIIEGAQEALASSGQVLLLANARELADGGRAFDRLVGEGRIDGLLWQGGGFDFDTALAARASRTLPTLLVNSRPLAEVGSVRLQDERAAECAVEHLRELGHERIGFLGGRPGSDLSERRKAGYRTAMGTVDEAFVVEQEWDATAGYAAMGELLARGTRPTAVLAANIVLGTGALAAAREWGIRVPEEMSVVTIHDAWSAAHAWPPLTTVRLPLREMGRRAVELVLDEPGRPELVLTDPPPELLVRASTAPPAD